MGVPGRAACPVRDYYIKKVKRQKVYCARNHGSEATVVAATRRRRQQKHTDKGLPRSERHRRMEPSQFMAWLKR
jgi:hypothetical protein